MPSQKYPWRKYKKSAAIKRQYMTYPKDKYYSLLEVYRAANEMGKSETLNHIIKQFFDQMPPAEIERLKAVAALNA